MSRSESNPSFADYKVALLAGGVGGAKLAEGMAQILPAENLAIIVNSGDDFVHLGLKICPDLDTVMYTLAGIANRESGWGRAEESWRVIGEVGRLGGPDWFSLGDLDLGTHLVRSHMLREGQTLTAVTRHLCRKLGVTVEILPMSDQEAPTIIVSESRSFSFQDWFVKERWQPPVESIRLPPEVKASPRVMTVLESSDLIVIAPSNPFVSIDPILNVYPIREMVMDLPQAVVAVTPIIGGRAVKGPAAKMMREMGMQVATRQVAEYYGELIDGFVYDIQDENSLDGLSVAQLCVNTWMQAPADRTRLARDVMTFAIAVANEQ